MDSSDRRTFRRRVFAAVAAAAAAGGAAVGDVGGGIVMYGRVHLALGENVASKC